MAGDGSVGRASGGRRPTSADVAREVGLSRTTVSFVLNDTPHQRIPEETRRRVLNAARKLGYAPSLAARALRNGRFDVVLCVLPDTPIGAGVGELLNSLSVLFDGAGLAFLAHPRATSAEPLSQIWTRITPAAVISLAPLPDADLDAMNAAGIDVAVAAFRGPGQPGFDQYSDEAVGRLQVGHLAGRGHRHIGYAFPADPAMANFATPRSQGVRRECADRGLDPPLTVNMEVSVASAVAAIRAWTAASPAVTAVCAYNDETALAVLAGLRELGLTAPTDLAVIGMDDMTAASFASPPLTTIRPDVDELAKRIAATVLRRPGIEPPAQPVGSDTLAVVVRESA